jgi:hypothetical protein
VAAVVCGYGFTPRQARFLVLVLEHSGVCLPPAFALRASAREAGNAGRLPGLHTADRRTIPSTSSSLAGLR